MATITLTDAAPKVDEAIRFSFGANEFEIKGSASYETDSQEVIAAAGAHPWLLVKIPAPKADDLPKPDQTDPHVNPRVDHLAAEASPEAIKAAAEEADRIRKEAASDVQSYIATEDAAAPGPVESTQKAVAQEATPQNTTPEVTA